MCPREWKAEYSSSSIPTAADPAISTSDADIPAC